MYKEKLIKFIEKNEASMLKDLTDFVEIPSISSDKEKVLDALRFILSLGEKLGFTSSSYLDEQVGVIRMGKGPEILGILSHVDVVAADDDEKWETPPFKCVLKNGNLYGRGTLDDKGAIIASLYAMKAVASLELPIYKEIQLILGTQEEVEWTDMNVYVKKFPLPDYGFTPDGEFPVCNIEKGSLDIVMEFPINDIPHSGNFLYSINAGSASNVVPQICTAEIAHITNNNLSITSIQTNGKSVHSCQPEKGSNAIFLMAEKLKDLNLKPCKLHCLIDMIYDKFFDLYGKKLNLYNENEYFNGEFVHRNVFSPTVIKLENNVLTLIVNVRYPFGSDSSQIIQTFENLARDNGGAVKQYEDLPAVYVSKDRPFVQSFAKAYESVTGRNNEFVLAYGGSYAKAIPNIVSWGPIFPEEEDTCHEVNEYISVKSLIDNAKIFSVAICDIALSNNSFK